MRLLLLLPVLLFSLLQAKDVSNPLASLMDPNASSEVQEFVNHMFSMVTSHVTLSALGLPPTLEEFKKDIANLTVNFFMLPVKDQKIIYGQIKDIAEKQKSAMNGKVSSDAVASQLEILDKRFNSPSALALFEEVDEKFDMLTQADEALEYIAERDPELGELAKQMLKEGREQYALLKTQEAKNFIWNCFEYLEKNEEKNVSDKTLHHLRDEFVKLKEEDRIDVVYRMTWFMNPIWEQMYRQMTTQATRMAQQVIGSQKKWQ